MKIKVQVNVEMEFNEDRAEEAVGLEPNEMIGKGIITIGETKMCIIDEDGTCYDDFNNDDIRKEILEKLGIKEA